MKLFYKLICFIHYYFDIFIDAVFQLYYRENKIRIPIPENNIVLESATNLATKIRNKCLSCEQVVLAFIHRINQINGIVNGIVDNRFNEALIEAKQIDERIKTDSISDKEFSEKPFLGIPFTSKESTHCKGLSVTFGLKKRLDLKADFDADYITAFKKAGGILLGVTNISQFNLWPETYNPVYGLTKNPYNVTRTVGGSAGGEACILAAAGTPIGLGTDIGGSSRIPALMCGVYAHKMSCNLIGVKGMTFRDGSETTSMICAGPMTKYATDLKPLLKCLVGDQFKELGLDEEVNVRKLNVYYIVDPNDYYCSPIRKEMTDALMRAVNHFKNICTVPPQELFFDELKYCKQIWSYCMSKEPNKNFLSDINNREGEVSPVKEILRKITIGSDFTLGSIMNFINILFSNVSDSWAEEITESLVQKLLAKLDDNSILLYPSAPFTARHHYTTIFHPMNFSFFSIWNVLKCPATQVPMGLGEENLPLGIQIVAKSNLDKLCIAAAVELEKHLGGYIPPF